MTDASYDFDFAVAGGGPAGSSAAISLGQRGHSVVLLERESFPRFHIGESLLSTANDAFAALGVRNKIEAACFPEKWGARLYTHNGQSGRYVDFTEVREVTRAQTFQVCRQEFDRILLERAREVGVDVRENCNVSACEFSTDAAILSVASRDDGATSRVRVRAVVDATGRAGLIARKFNLRTDEPRLANIAVFSHYTNVPRLEGPRPDDIRLIARADAGWFWIIPISKELTSVGVVLPKALYRRLANGSSEETLNKAIADTPSVAGLMRQARREWPVRVEKDFCTALRRMRAIAGSWPGTQDRFSIRYFRQASQSRWNPGLKLLPSCIVRWQEMTSRLRVSRRSLVVSANASRAFGDLLWDSTRPSSATCSSVRNHRDLFFERSSLFLPVNGTRVYGPAF